MAEQLLPTDNDSILNIEMGEQQPSYTFAFDLDKKIMRGMCDNEQAIKQAVYLILFTERYKWLIHPFSYGHELNKLFGLPMTYCIPEIERLVTEALTADDRIDKVEDFFFRIGEHRNNLLVDFTVVTNIEGIEKVKIQDFDIVI